MEKEQVTRPCDAQQEEAMSCEACEGMLPSCAHLAVPYVPFQQDGARTFEQNAALSHGTLFPCLDLPFRSKERPTNAVQNALNELQALEFVLVELGLYLDTHPEDSEAFALFQKYTALEKSGRERYEAAYGPITRDGVAQNSKNFSGWTQDPWPWNYEGGER